MKQTIILKRDNNDVFFKYINPKPIHKYYKISDNNYMFKLIRKLKIPLLHLFFNNWTKNLNQYKKIVLFDNGFNEQVAKYIKKKNKEIKIVLWYWNPIFEHSKKFLSSKYLDEIWTYSKSDAEKYNINYNTQFYTTKLELPKNEIKYNVIFLGSNKGRKKELIELEQKLNLFGLTTNFKIIENAKDYVEYDNYLEMLSMSDCIVDFCSDGRQELTLRTMEALFLKKKLITNNKDIFNYDFYNKNNIFVLGVDDINTIKEFILCPCYEINNNIVEQYDFENWYKRFE